MNNNKITPQAATKLISTHWRSIANSKKLEDREWYLKNWFYTRQIAIECIAIMLSTSWKPGEANNLSELDINSVQVATRLKNIWELASTLIVENIVTHYNGEYHVMKAELEAKQFGTLWCEDYTKAHFFDYVETLMVDAVASQQINITCLKALCDIVKIDLESISCPSVTEMTMN